MTQSQDKEAEWSRWMAAAQDGDRAAYERLLRDIVPFLKALVTPQHRAPDRAEEVVQEILLTIHRVRHTYDPARPIRPWLAAIARRRSIDALRRRGRSAAREIHDETAYETFADPRANRLLEVSAAREGLSEAIEALSPPQREAIELLKLRELSLAEAASLSGRSVAALKVNVHRALKALRQRLQGGEE